MPFSKNPFKDEAPMIPTSSGINTSSLEAQNKRLYDHLAAGNTIHFLQAREMGIGFLNSRVADLRSFQIPVYSRFIRISNIKCKEYSLVPFNDN